MATTMTAQALTDPTYVDTTLWDALERNFAQRPNHPALTTLYEPAEHLSQLLPPTLRHNGTSEGFSWTYAQLVAGVETVARHFIHLGLRTGDRLAVFMTSSVENLVCMLACMRIGVTWATSNPAFAEDVQHASHILDTIKPRGILVSSSKQAEALSRYIPTAGSDERPTFLFLCGSEDGPQDVQWTTLKDIMQAPVPMSEGFDRAVSMAKENKPLSLVMFTSGTTNLPKACPISPMFANHTLHSGTEYLGIHQQTRLLISGPLFHGMGIWLSLMALYKAGTVCIATKQFDPATCLHTLETLKCTCLGLAPSMVYSVISQPNFVAGAYRQVETFSLGADYVSKDVVELVQASFQPRRVLNGWGMTEGMFCLSAHHSDPIIWHGDLCFSGYVVPGSNIRICDPETGRLLSRGETGELQMSGPSVIEGYFAGGKNYQNEAFCTDGSRTWFRSGDAALMREGGEVFISGRYKDMIIRGGENMSPGYIENCINGIEGVKSQVVGLPDAVMGEVPVAVLEVSNPNDIPAMKKEVLKRVEQSLGISFRPAKVYTVQDLGLDAFPKTANGKLYKQGLRELLAKTSDRSHQKDNAKTDTVQQVVELWQELTSADADTLHAHSSMADFVDSLLIIRFCYDVEKKLGKKITFAQVVENETPAKQAAIMDKGHVQTDSEGDGGIRSLISESSRFSDDDFPGPEREAILKEHLQSMGFNWDQDVEDVFQPQDSTRIFWASMARSNSSNHRFLFKLKGLGSRVQDVEKAIKATLEIHPSFRVVMVPFTAEGGVIDMLHVVIKTKSLPQTWCMQSDPVDHDVLTPMSRDLKLPLVGPWRPACRIQITPIKDSDDVALFMFTHHQILDGLTMDLFLGNFRAALSSQTSEISHPIPNRIFADLYRSHKGGFKGRRSLEYQLHKLKALPASDEVFWPPLKAPGLFIGRENDWQPESDSSPRISTDDAIGRPRGTPIVLQTKTPELAELKRKHSIDASIIAKSAVALYTLAKTSQTTAVFANLEAARTWPFLEPLLESRLPSPLNIDGGLITHNINFISTSRDQIVLEFLSNNAAQQKLDSHHAQAPWASIVATLSSSQRYWLDQAARRQVFNWLPTPLSGVSTETIQLLNYHSWNDRTAQWNFSLLGKDTLQCSFLYDDVQLTAAQATEAVESVLSIAKAMATEENLGARLGDVASL